MIKVNKNTTVLNTELRQTYAATALLKYVFKFFVKALIEIKMDFYNQLWGNGTFVLLF